MKKKIANMKRDYERDPVTPEWENWVIRLHQVGGWVKRDKLERLSEEARMNFSSAIGHIEKKDYLNALVCLEDGIADAQKIKEFLRL